MISPSMADKVRGDGPLEDLVGESLLLTDGNGEVLYNVVLGGIFETPPGNSSQYFDLLIPYELAPPPDPSRDDIGV